MEVFTTRNNENPLKIKMTLSSDAALDGPNEILVVVYPKENIRKYRKIDVTRINDNEYHCEIEKSRFEERPMIKIKCSFIVDSSQFPDKERIIIQTENGYLFNDMGNDKEYLSKYTEDNPEYNKGSAADETFSVTKKIEVKFI